MIALYTSVQNDITNYRNWKWKITTYYVLLSTGIIGLLSNETVKNLLDDRLRCCFLIIQLIAIITSWYHLYKAHKYLSWNRQVRSKIEAIFGFYDDGIYAEKSILPSEWKIRKISFFFEFKDFVFPFMIFLFLYEIFVVYLIWKL
ncbi:MAG: hypothetical protein ACREOW_11055 [Thermodesulfobacteriota bacterium]